MAYVYNELSVGEIAQRLYADKENNGFSLEGVRSLAEWLNDLASDSDEPIELDVVALRCDWTEYGDLEDFNRQHHGGKNQAEFHKSIDDLEGDTYVIRLDDGNGFLAQTF